MQNILDIKKCLSSRLHRNKNQLDKCIVPSQIGNPTEFQHVKHVGKTDVKIDAINSIMTRRKSSIKIDKNRISNPTSFRVIQNVSLKDDNFEINLSGNDKTSIRMREILNNLNIPLNKKTQKLVNNFIKNHGGIEKFENELNSPEKSNEIDKSDNSHKIFDIEKLYVGTTIDLISFDDEPKKQIQDLKGTDNILELKEPINPKMEDELQTISKKNHIIDLESSNQPFISTNGTKCDESSHIYESIEELESIINSKEDDLTSQTISKGENIEDILIEKIDNSKSSIELFENIHLENDKQPPSPLLPTFSSIVLSPLLASPTIPSPPPPLSATFFSEISKPSEKSKQTIEAADLLNVSLNAKKISFSKKTTISDSPQTTFQGTIAPPAPSGPPPAPPLPATFFSEISKPSEKSKQTIEAADLLNVSLKTSQIKNLPKANDDLLNSIKSFKGFSNKGGEKKIEPCLPLAKKISILDQLQDELTKRAKYLNDSDGEDDGVLESEW